MNEPKEVEKVWHCFAELKETSSDAIQLLSMTLNLDEQKKQSLRNKADSIRQGLAELDEALTKL